jgi:DNA-binding SARP family transcriptional activator
MEFLEWDQLRFTLEESKNIVYSRIPGLRKKEIVERFHQIANGWVAGLILISDAVRRGAEIHSLEKITPDEIVNYFGSVIFSKTKEETQTFLMKTAFLPRMTVKMSEELTCITNAESILSGLTRNNYFIEQHHSTEPVYQYHPLFRSFLLSRAKELFSREVIVDLNHRAALQLEEYGRMDEAAEIYMDQKNWEGLIRLIMKHGPSLMAQGRYQLLEKWLTCLPEDLVENNPWLLFWLGACRFPFDPSQSLRCYEKAFEKFRQESDMTGTFLSWSSIVDVIDFSHNDLSRLDHWIHVLEDLTRGIKEFPSQEIEAKVASGMVAALALRQPQHPEFHKWADQALSLTESPQMINIRMWALFQLTLHGCLMGEFERAAYALNLLSQLTRSRDASPFLKIMGKLADAMFYQFTGSHEKCMEAVSDGMKLSRMTGIHITDQPLLAHAISSSININDLETARQFLDRFASSLNRFLSSDDILNIRNRLIYHFLCARYALCCGDLAEFPFHIDLALKYGNQVGAPLFISMNHLINAFAMHRLGKKEEALDQLQKGFLIAQETESKILEIVSLMTQAFFAFDQGEKDSGLQFLKMALALGKDQRYLNTFFDDPSVTAKLCARALEEGIEVEYVQEMIRKRNLIPDKGSLQLEHWPWPLKIYTLGQFSVLKDGKPIPYSRKAQEKPLSILKVLIIMRDKGTRTEDIADILWPEANGDLAYHSFQTALHRLRSLIGYSETVLVREGRLSLDPNRCWVDAWAFERLLEEADILWKEGIAQKAIQLTENALALYQGPLLGKEGEQPWQMPVRERLRNKFLRSVSRLGDHWIQAGQWETARDCYQKGFEVDDLSEGFCKGLMTCYHHLDQRADALSLYQRFEKRLKTVLGIEPSEKIKALHYALTKKTQSA